MAQTSGKASSNRVTVTKGGVTFVVPPSAKVQPGFVTPSVSKPSVSTPSKPSGQGGGGVSQPTSIPPTKYYTTAQGTITYRVGGASPPSGAIEISKQEYDIRGSAYGGKEIASRMPTTTPTKFGVAQPTTTPTKFGVAQPTTTPTKFEEARRPISKFEESVEYPFGKEIMKTSVSEVKKQQFEKKFEYPFGKEIMKTSVSEVRRKQLAGDIFAISSGVPVLETKIGKTPSGKKVLLTDVLTTISPTEFARMEAQQKGFTPDATIGKAKPFTPIQPTFLERKAFEAQQKGKQGELPGWYEIKSAALLETEEMRKHPIKTTAIIGGTAALGYISPLASGIGLTGLGAYSLTTELATTGKMTQTIGTSLPYLAISGTIAGAKYGYTSIRPTVQAKELRFPIEIAEESMKVTIAEKGEPITKWAWQVKSPPKTKLIEMEITKEIPTFYEGKPAIAIGATKGFGKLYPKKLVEAITKGEPVKPEEIFVPTKSKIKTIPEISFRMGKLEPVKLEAKSPKSILEPIYRRGYEYTKFVKPEFKYTYQLERVGYEPIRLIKTPSVKKIEVKKMRGRYGEFEYRTKTVRLHPESPPSTMFHEYGHAISKYIAKETNKMTPEKRLEIYQEVYRRFKKPKTLEESYTTIWKEIYKPAGYRKSEVGGEITADIVSSYFTYPQFKTKFPTTTDTITKAISHYKKLYEVKKVLTPPVEKIIKVPPTIYAKEVKLTESIIKFEPTLEKVTYGVIKPRMRIIKPKEIGKVIEPKLVPKEVKYMPEAKDFPKKVIEGEYGIVARIKQSLITGKGKVMWRAVELEPIPSARLMSLQLIKAPLKTVSKVSAKEKGIAFEQVISKPTTKADISTMGLRLSSGEFKPPEEIAIIEEFQPKPKTFDEIIQERKMDITPKIGIRQTTELIGIQKMIPILKQPSLLIEKPQEDIVPKQDLILITKDITEIIPKLKITTVQGEEKFVPETYVPLTPPPFFPPFPPLIGLPDILRTKKKRGKQRRYYPTPTLVGIEQYLQTGIPGKKMPLYRSPLEIVRPSKTLIASIKRGMVGGIFAR